MKNISMLNLTSVLDDDDRAILLFDLNGQVTYANQHASALLGTPTKLLIGKTEDDFAANPRWSHMTLPLLTAGEGRKFSGEVMPLHDNSGWWVRCSPIPGGTACHFNRLGNEAGRSADTSRYDGLTALPGRHAFFKRLRVRLEQARQRGTTFCVAYVDLDRFKWQNYTLGHSAGDALLIAFVRRLTCSLPQKSLVARLGGDEFAIAFPLGTSETAGIGFISDILFEVMQPYTIVERQVRLSASAGLVGFPCPSAGTVNEGLLIDLADFALRQAKANGRGRISMIDERAVYEFERQRGLAKWLHDAISRKAFSLHYQPLVDVRNNKVKAVEALLRPDSGISGIAISEVINLAENEGLMPTLGYWVLETACQQLADWRRDGHNVDINVNLAPAQLLDTSFIVDATRLLRDYGLKPSDITFEISERMAVSEETSIAGTIDSLLENDFRLSIDDFGIEYASIGRVARMPIHQVKFDRSLVGHLDDGSKQSLMVSGLIQLIGSDDLEMSVVAEGIETPSLRDHAVAAGAELLQGFGLHRPMPAEEVVRFL